MDTEVRNIRNKAIRNISLLEIRLYRILLFVDSLWTCVSVPFGERAEVLSLGHRVCALQEVGPILLIS